MKWGSAMKKKWVSYLVFFCAILSGVCYCIYLQNRDVNFFKVVYSQILTMYEQEISKEIIFKLFLDYVKKICIVFALGSFSVLVPLAFCVMFIIVFSYSFTTSCFITLYGLKGALVAFLLYGSQSIVVILSGFYILNYKWHDKQNGVKESGKNNLIYIVGMMLMGMGIMVGFDLLGILNFDLIKQLLL